MLSFFISVAAFLVAIAILVAVHEWGHYIVARMVGVKVLRFSIGFGRRLWSRQSGADQTEFCLSAIPIGGYVKLLDERDCAVTLEEQHRALNRQSTPARIAILLAGPGLNFIFAILAYWCMFMIGVPGTKPVVGEVLEASIAERAGLVAGDQIIRVGERDVATWEGTILAMLQELLSEGDIQMLVTGEGDNQRSVVLGTAGRAAELTEPGELFAGIGIKTWSPSLPAVIDKLTLDGAAEKAGMLSGDQVVEVDGIAINSWSEWVEYVRARPDELVQATVLRGADAVELTIDIGTAEVGDETIGRIGASVSIPDDLYDEMRADQRYAPFDAMKASLSKNWEMIGLTLRMIASMVTGDVSMKNISGPINIAQYAGVSASIGVVPFLNFLAIVSISLGVLNLLPIPMLDGGQILYQLIEVAKGSPLSDRSEMVGQQIGILFLFLLMGVAFYNDLSRIFG
jgi:regulator of sigma E protease